jgi:PAS domain S-box-containing protein
MGMRSTASYKLDRPRQLDPKLPADVFEHAFGDAAIGLAIVSLDGRWIQANQALCDIVGYDAEEMRGTHLPGHHPPRRRGDRHRARPQAHPGRRPSYEREKRYVCRNGSIVWVQLTVSLVRDDHGTPLYMISQILNVHSRKAADEALLASQALLAESQAIAQLGSWEWDVTTGAIAWSDGLYAVYGLDPTEFEPSFEGFLERVHPDDRAIAERHAVEAGRDGTPFDYEHRIMRPDGEIRYLSSRGTATLDGTGRVIRVTGTEQDVTDLRLATLQLERANAGLTRSVAGLQLLNRWFGLLRELSELLQHAPDADEVGSVVSIGARLFSGDTGALYLRKASADLLAPIATWGTPLPVDQEPALEDRWSVRRSRLHLVEDVAGIGWRHAAGTDDTYVCVPMLARGEALLHVRRKAGAASSVIEIAELVAAVAENAALALTTCSSATS